VAEIPVEQVLAELLLAVVPPELVAADLVDLVLMSGKANL
jgi:hypothetical protein